MGKSQKKSAPWMVVARGVLMAAILYLVLQLLLALLAAKGVLPEKHVYPVQVVTCLLSVLLGARYTAKRLDRGTMTSALMVSGAYTLLMLLIGFLAFDKIVWSKQSAGLLLAVLCGGILAGLLGGKSGKRRHKKPIGK